MIKKITLILVLFFAALAAQAQPFCDQAQTGPGFPSNLTCQNSVCALDAFCCTNTWDSICAGEAAVDPNCASCLVSAGGGGGPFCDQAQTGPGFPSNLTCQNSVCALDAFCCTNTWDSICAGEAAVDPNCASCLVSAGGGGGPFCDQAQTGPGFPSNLACQNSVCALDAFCCSNTWDSICAGEAAVDPNCASCLASTGGGGGPYCDQGQPFPTPGFPSAPACQAAICAADSYCCNTSWDALCAGAAATNPSCTSCLAPPPPPEMVNS